MKALLSGTLVSETDLLRMWEREKMEERESIEAVKSVRYINRQVSGAWHWHMMLRL